MSGDSAPRSEDLKRELEYIAVDFRRVVRRRAWPVAVGRYWISMTHMGLPVVMRICDGCLR